MDRGETINIYGWESGFFTKDGLLHLILPSISLSSIMMPLFIRLIRSEMMEVLETEYVKFAWAKGLKRRRIWLIHAFKNTLLPVITVLGVQIGIMFAFTILTETVFQWQGMGFMFLGGRGAIRHVPSGGISGCCGCYFCGRSIQSSTLFMDL